MNKVFGAASAPRFWLAWAAGLALAAATVVMSATEGIPIRDPDDVMPAYVQMPAIVLLAIGLDIVPRALRRAGRPGGGWGERLAAQWRAVVQERWPASHWRFALSGLAAWYLSYAAFRNVKNMAPLVHPKLYDGVLADIDQFLFAGHDPAAVLHGWLGTGVAAHLFSGIYILWIGVVPASIAIALVWTRHTRAGEWYVTAVAVDWAVGALLYVLVPTVGPIYSDKEQFAALPHTYVTDLQNGMWDDRVAVLADPTGTHALQTIAAFASLHVGIMVTICLIGHLIGLPRWVRVTSWVFLVATILATVYLGWHFACDVVGGFALGAFAVWAAGMATGNRVGWRLRLTPEQAVPASVERLAAPVRRSAPLPDPPAVD